MKFVLALLMLTERGPGSVGICEVKSKREEKVV